MRPPAEIKDQTRDIEDEFREIEDQMGEINDQIGVSFAFRVVSYRPHLYKKKIGADTFGYVSQAIHNPLKLLTGMIGT